METNRFYRNFFNASDLCYFHACVEQTDLYIGADRNLEKEAVLLIQKYRDELTDYIRRHPKFMSSLVPVTPIMAAPHIAVDMCRAAELAGVGPMAAVAGAFSKFVGQELLAFSEEIVVENGGDIFLKSSRDRKIGIYAGNSPLSNKLAIKITGDMTPCGICTSSGTIGHSLSFGKADAAVVLHPDASVADACATALGNLVKSEGDIEDALSFISRVPGVQGAVVIIGDRIGAIGDIELCKA